MSEECYVFKDVKKVKKKFYFKKLPSECNFLHKPYVEQDAYKSHLERLKNIKAETETNAPTFMITTFFPLANIIANQERLEIILKENLLLLGRLNDISRSNSIYYERKDRNCQDNENARYQFKLKTIEKIERDNFHFGKRILNITGEVPSTKELNQTWTSTLMKIRRQCHREIILPELLRKKSFTFIAKNRPMVYLDVGIENSRPLGRLIISLYLDLAPITVKNFIDLCENHRDWPNPICDDCSDYEKQRNSIQNSSVSYEYINKNCQLMGTKFTRIFPKLFIYAGTLNVNNETDFQGIRDYAPEKFKFHHGYKGTLSMCPMENGLINSEFTFSLKPLHVLDGKRLAFGRIIKGLGILDTISSYGTKNGKPQKMVEILDCGILDLNLE